MIQFSVDPVEGHEVTIQAKGRTFKTRCVLKTDDFIRLEIPASNGSSFVEFKRSGDGWIVFDSYTDDEKRPTQ